MRVVGAGLFVFVGLCVVALLVMKMGLPTGLSSALTVMAMFLLLVVAYLLFNARDRKLWPRVSHEERMRQLEEQGLVESTDFQALRAFEMQELEDEGMHYFVELTDGRVLFLSGQYLYDYGPISDDPRHNRPRTFPCTDFTVKRHKKAGYVVDLVNRGSPLEPEASGSFTTDDYRSERVPEDGEILTDASYDQLKARWALRS
jgi:hypothetical protein